MFFLYLFNPYYAFTIMTPLLQLVDPAVNVLEFAYFCASEFMLANNIVCYYFKILRIMCHLHLLGIYFLLLHYFKQRSRFESERDVTLPGLFSRNFPVAYLGLCQYRCICNEADCFLQYMLQQCVAYIMWFAITVLSLWRDFRIFLNNMKRKTELDVDHVTEFVQTLSFPFHVKNFFFLDAVSFSLWCLLML